MDFVHALLEPFEDDRPTCPKEKPVQARRTRGGRS